jgi:hypothetical protein
MMSTTGPHSDNSRADADAADRVLADGRVAHALASEFLDESLRHFESAAVFSDVFAQNEHVGVALHLFGHRFAQRPGIVNFAHSEYSSFVSGILIERCSKSHGV